MENSEQPLATESFSYSWLTHKPPHSLRRIEDEDDDDGDDGFRFEVSSSPPNLVNADEIFSEGKIMAVYSRTTSSSVPASSLSTPFLRAGGRSPCCVLHRWTKIVRKCLGFVNRSVGWSRKSVRVDDIQRKVLEHRSFDASPKQNSELMDDYEYGFEFVKTEKNYWRILPSPNRSTSYDCCDADENSIREAILYCKRSIEN